MTLMRRTILLGVVVAPLVAGLTGCEVATFSEDARRKGLALYQQNNYTDAAGSFQNAVKQRPTDYKSYYYLGQSYEKLDQLQRAIQAYKAARDVQPETLEGIQDRGMRAQILDALASAVARSGDKDREIEILKQRAAVARNGEDLVTLARVYRYAGDPDNAIATYDTAMSRFPREQVYAKEYGLYLKSLGLNSRARQVLTHTAAIKPDAEVNEALKGL
jgi:tetratricopeptide (TPR) repeat protein